MVTAMETTPKASPPMIALLFLARQPSTEWVALTAMETDTQIPTQCGLQRTVATLSEKTQRNGPTLMRMVSEITGATRHGMTVIHHGLENTVRIFFPKMHVQPKLEHHGKTE